MARAQRLLFVCRQLLMPNTISDAEIMAGKPGIFPGGHGRARTTD
jgi:hypothetical protein